MEEPKKPEVPVAGAPKAVEVKPEEPTVTPIALALRQVGQEAAQKANDVKKAATQALRSPSKVEPAKEKDSTSKDERSSSAKEEVSDTTEGASKNTTKEEKSTLIPLKTATSPTKEKPNLTGNKSPTLGRLAGSPMFNEGASPKLAGSPMFDEGTSPAKEKFIPQPITLPSSINRLTEGLQSPKSTTWRKGPDGDFMEAIQAIQSPISTGWNSIGTPMAFGSLSQISQPPPQDIKKVEDVKAIKEESQESKKAEDMKAT